MSVFMWRTYPDHPDYQEYIWRFVEEYPTKPTDGAYEIRMGSVRKGSDGMWDVRLSLSMIKYTRNNTLDEIKQKQRVARRKTVDKAKELVEAKVVAMFMKSLPTPGEE
jgi:hypothetical protein